MSTVTVYSENGEFYLRSVPWDNESPSLRGTTSVYQVGNAAPMYTFTRGFDRADRNLLSLSNDGETIFYAIDYEAKENQDELKSVSIYRRGKFAKGFTEREVNGCDSAKERCQLIYFNYDEVVDRARTQAAGGRMFLRNDLTEKERFLLETPLFIAGDKVFLVDSKKQVHVFDLKTLELTHAGAFDANYEQLKKLARQNRIERLATVAPVYYDFPNLATGERADQALAKAVGMKLHDDKNHKDEQYRRYGFKIDVMLDRNGTVEIENIELFDELPKERIVEFFRSNRFDARALPDGFDKWHIEEYFYLRKSDDILARIERREQLTKEKENLKKLLVAETIGDRYIPANLGECFIELDKILTVVQRKEI